MINRVVLVGRLTKDLELRYTPSGVAVANGTIAVNRPFSNQQGEREADFIQIVIWRRQAENAGKYTAKGSLIGIEGRLQTRSYENNEGRRVYITEVVCDSVQFLESKGARQNNQQQSTNYQSSPPSDPNDPFARDLDPFAGDGKPIDISDDDMPF